MAIKVSVTGKAALIAALLKCEKEVTKELRKGMKEAFTLIQSDAVNNSGYIPRSGNLDRLVKSPDLQDVNESGTKGKVELKKTSQVPYSFAQHEGYKGIKPKKFLSRSGKRNKHKVISIIDGAINRAIKKAGL